MRSGRIKGQNLSGTPLTIVSGRPGVIRIYNSGERDFNVRPEGLSTPAAREIPLARRGSVDIESDGRDVLVARADALEVKGIYEFIDPSTPIRPGRFNGSAAGAGITIIQNMSNRSAIYRVLNSSGTAEFEVRVDGSSIITLQPRHSIDIAAPRDAKVTVNASGAVRGIYDYLDPNNTVQSGRFSYVAANPSDRRKIVDFTGAPSRRHYYRIFNAGAEAFAVKRDGPTIAAKLEPDQSIDFHVDSIDKTIWVNSHLGANKLIEGIYDYLGSE